MRGALPGIRFASAALFALLLVLRIIAPSGFMPVFERGTVTVTACPDQDPLGAGMGDADHSVPPHKVPHQACPYAFASALQGFHPAYAVALTTISLIVAIPMGCEFLSIAPESRAKRPPSTAPPMPA